MVRLAQLNMFILLVRLYINNNDGGWPVEAPAHYCAGLEASIGVSGALKYS